jgi:fructose-1,6-bisphosphatase
MAILFLVVPILSGCLGFFLNLLIIKIVLNPSANRQKKLVLSISKIINDQINITQILQTQVINKEVFFDSIQPDIEKHVDYFLRVKLKEQIPVISVFIGEKTISQMKEVLQAELKNILPQIIDTSINRVEKSFNVGEFIATKIINLNAAEKKSILKILIKKLVLWGLINGIIIGLVIVIIETLLIYFMF